MKHKYSIRLVYVVMMSSVFVLAGCAEKSETDNKEQPASFTEPAVITEPNELSYISQEKMLEEKWGVKIERAMLSAGNYMIDFRFRVLDAEKAEPILNRKINPYLVDQASGATFAVPSPPKLGQMRSSGNVKEGNLCIIMFANPAKYVKSGNKVTIVVGDFKVKDVVVQ